MPNIFEHYLVYTRTKEPPPNFNAWSAIAAISAALGKKCQVPQGAFTIYPNLNIVLVGDPGSRKTTAMNIGRKVVESLASIPLAPDSVTRESLIDDMARNQVEAFDKGKEIPYWQSSAFVSELEQFLGGRHINHQMVGFLTAIWDSNSFKERTRKGGEVVIPNPYFTMLGCCTLTWMNEKLRSDVISDGFTRRTIFCLETEPNCLNDWPTMSYEEMTAGAYVNREIARIHSLAGKFHFTIPARVYYKKRYDTLREEAKQHTEKVQYYFSSKHNLAMKIAMCLSACYRSDRVVDSNIIRLAYTFLDDSERNMDKIFSGVGQNTKKALADKVLDKIAKSADKGIEHGDLLAYAFHDVDQSTFLEIIEVLTQTGQISLDTLVISAPPRYRVAKQVTPLAAVNLLELASQTTPVIEPLASDLLSVAEYHLSDQVPLSVAPRPSPTQTAKPSVALRQDMPILSTENPLGPLGKALG